MIQLTTEAVTKAKTLLEESGDDLVLRIGVRAGGCSGLSYELIFDNESDGDIRQMFDGLVIVMDPESAPYLEGATLNYVEGLMGAGFKFSNPNETRSCGCGKSFS